MGNDAIISVKAVVRYARSRVSLSRCVLYYYQPRSSICDLFTRRHVFVDRISPFAGLARVGLVYYVFPLYSPEETTASQRSSSSSLFLFLSHSPFPIRFSSVFSLREPINYILISRRLSSPFCTFSLARCTPRFSEARHGFAGSIRDRLTFWVTPSRPCECRNKSLCLSRSMDAPAVFSPRVLRVSPSRPISGEIDNASFCSISIGPLFVVAREALSVGLAKKKQVLSSATPRKSV